MGKTSENIVASNQGTASEEIKTAYDSQWTEVVTLLQKEIGAASVKNWISPLVFISAKQGTLKLSAPTRFLADWVRSHYVDAIRRLWNGHVAPVSMVDINVDPAIQASVANEDSPENKTTPANTAAPSSSNTFFDTRLDPNMTFDGFVTGPANELAFAAAKRISQSGETLFNPLYFYGGVGIGKTHLMHAIGWELQERFPEKNVVYLSAEKFMYHFVRALREKDMVAFKDAFRSVDILMIDDIQFISGKKSTQQEFIHTFNAMMDQGKQLIVAADKSPAELEGLDARLKSRLGGGLSVDIQPADFELRRKILSAKAAQTNHDVPDDVLDYLAERIATNVRELEGALNRILAFSDLMNLSIDLKQTEQILGDLFRAYDRKVTVEDIQKAVVEFYGLKMSDMSSARRLRAVARPRQIAMYLAKKMTACSLPEIGRQFGGRDHTTVMHAVRKVEDLLQNDAMTAEDVDRIEMNLKSI